MLGIYISEERHICLLLRNLQAIAEEAIVEERPDGPTSYGFADKNKLVKDLLVDCENWNNIKVIEQTGNQQPDDGTGVPPPLANCQQCLANTLGDQLQTFENYLAGLTSPDQPHNIPEYCNYIAIKNFCYYLYILRIGIF